MYKIIIIKLFYIKKLKNIAKNILNKLIIKEKKFKIKD